MKTIKFIIIFFIITSCNNNYSKEYYLDKNLNLYELKCNEKYYLAFEKCNCNFLPINYFTPIVDNNDNFYEIHIKNNIQNVIVTGLYTKFNKYGSIEKNVKFITIEDNSFYQDSIVKNNEYHVYRSYIIVKNKEYHV